MKCRGWEQGTNGKDKRKIRKMSKKDNFKGESSGEHYNSWVLGTSIRYEYMGRVQGASTRADG